MDGLDRSAVVQKIQTDWPIYMSADLAFWPFFQFLNFRFVPLHYQTTAIYVASLFWSVVMSTIESRETTEISQVGEEKKLNVTM